VDQAGVFANTSSPVNGWCPDINGADSTTTRSGTSALCRPDSWFDLGVDELERLYGREINAIL
jgi:hypothetical protein